ncbi:acyltransferase family protein [uncultured Corynebacterium sp.]|uniref:acyltransferase family protein n=1 Tax=uncultured Corynebacterium sp. TaxID=159447 RepID=UPI0025F16DA6|nr:acyltransferase family protein [uncultured Corynebacterium sp.]
MSSSNPGGGSSAQASAPASAPTGAKRRPYRRDIDGLRGLAIALVVVFHVFIGRVSSGVDVFLLVGGIFFFGPQIRNALDPAGQTLIQSVVRLLRRLYPALLVVVTVTLAAGFVVYARARWRHTAEDAAASLTYRQNLHLADQGQDYAAVGRDVSLYQHIWSMSAQLQIYLGSLLAIVALAWLLKRVPSRFPARSLHVLLIVATLASFVYAVHLHGTDQGWNYYSPLSRFWEIGLGGLLGIWLVHRETPSHLAWLRWPAGVVGVVLIVGTGLFLDGAAQFPGPWTLVPLAGATLVILSGNPVADGRGTVGVSSLLNTRPLQFLGRISYSLYLWHWPLLVLATFHFSDVLGNRSTGVQGITATLGTRDGLVIGTTVIVISLVLARVTERYIETPLRQARRPARAWLPSATVVTDVPGHRTAVAVVTAVVVATVGVLAAGPVIRHRDDVRLAATDAEELDPALYPGPRAFLEDAPVPDGQPVRPDVANADHMMPQTDADGCIARIEDTELVLTRDGNNSEEPCAYGDLSSPRTMYLAGGSHSEHYLPALDVIGRERGVRIVPVLKMGCVLGMPLPRIGDDDFPECREWHGKAERHILDNPPTDGVFMPVTRPTTLEGDGPDYTPAEYVDMVRVFSDAGIHTWGVRDNPWNMQAPGVQGDGRLCVAEGSGSGPAADCGADGYESLSPVNPALAAFAGLDVTVIDLTPALCRDGRCPAVVGNVLVYRDGNHLSDVYSRMLAPELERQMFDPVALAETAAAQGAAVADAGTPSDGAGATPGKDVFRIRKPGEVGED